MLPKGVRLSTQDIQRFMKQRNRRIDGSLMTLVIGPVVTETTTGAVVTSRKVSTKAVQRNAVRRRIYRIIATLLPSLGTASFMIMVKKSALGATVDELQDELQGLFAKTPYVKEK